MYQSTEADGCRQKAAPKDCARGLSSPDTKWRSPMEPGNFGKRMSAPHRANPPLTKSRHSSVMLCHLSIKSPDFPPSFAQPHAELWCSAANQLRPEPAYRLERLHTHQGVSTAGRGFTDGRIPLEVTEL